MLVVVVQSKLMMTMTPFPPREEEVTHIMNFDFESVFPLPLPPPSMVFQEEKHKADPPRHPAIPGIDTSSSSHSIPLFFVA